MANGLLLLVLLILDWLIVLLWTARILAAVRNLPRVPNLLDPRYAQPIPASAGVLVAVIVPACNEDAKIEASLRALLAIEAIPLDIIAIDDRSMTPPAKLSTALPPNPAHRTPPGSASFTSPIFLRAG